MTKKNKALLPYNLVKWNDTFRIGYDIRISPTFDNDQITLSIYDIHYYEHVKHCKRDHIARFTIPNNGFKGVYAKSARPGQIQTLYGNRPVTKFWQKTWRDRGNLRFLGHGRGHTLGNKSQQLNAYAFIAIRKDDPNRIHAWAFFEQGSFSMEFDCTPRLHQFNMGLLTPEAGHSKISIGKDEVTI